MSLYLEISPGFGFWIFTTFPQLPLFCSLTSIMCILSLYITSSLAPLLHHLLSHSHFPLRLPSTYAMLPQTQLKHIQINWQTHPFTPPSAPLFPFLGLFLFLVSSYQCEEINNSTFTRFEII